MRLITILATLTLTIAASADPPSRRVCNVPLAYSSTYQQIVPHSINAATIYADTHLNIVEVPVPAFVFQTLTAYIPQAQVQQVPVQQTPIQAAPDGVGTDDQLAALLGKAPAPLISPLTEIGQKCGSCHSGGAVKGGLTLIDASGQYNPSTTKNNTLTRSGIAARAKSTGDDAMPPGVLTNPGKRLSEDAIRFLEQ